MFRSPEQALIASFTIIEYRIEPKNATQVVVERLRERYGLELARLPSGLTPHDWHAQAVMTIQFTKRTLVQRPELWRAVLAEYSMGVAGAEAIQQVSSSLVPGLEGEARLLADMLVMRQFRRKPALRSMADRFDLSERTLARRERWWREALGPLRRQALQELATPMETAGIVTRSREYAMV